MNNSSLHTLVNFRASRQLVESFDNVCLLAGKTRTQVLAEMMRQRVNTVGSKLPARLANERSIDDRLAEAVEPMLEQARIDLEFAKPPTTPERRAWSVGAGSGRRKFSSFELPSQSSC